MVTLGWNCLFMKFQNYEKPNKIRHPISSSHFWTGRFHRALTHLCSWALLWCWRSVAETLVHVFITSWVSFSLHLPTWGLAYIENNQELLLCLQYTHLSKYLCLFTYIFPGIAPPLLIQSSPSLNTCVSPLLWCWPTNLSRICTTDDKAWYRPWKQHTPSVWPERNQPPFRKITNASPVILHRLLLFFFTF